MRNFDAALFDIDGTLLDTEELLLKSFEHTLAKNNIVKTRDEIKSLIGNYIKVIYQNLSPESSSSELDVFIQTHFAFQESLLNLSIPFPQTIKTLETLKGAGVHIAVLTNRVNTSRQSMEISGIDKFVDLTITAADVTHPKPHQESIEKALSHFRVDASKAIMIGDSPADILTGKNAGVKTVGVSFGIHGEKIKDQNPDFVINDIADVLPIILAS